MSPAQNRESVIIDFGDRLELFEKFRAAKLNEVERPYLPLLDLYVPSDEDGSKDRLLEYQHSAMTTTTDVFNKNQYVLSRRYNFSGMIQATSDGTGIVTEHCMWRGVRVTASLLLLGEDFFLVIEYDSNEKGVDAEYIVARFKSALPVE